MIYLAFVLPCLWRSVIYFRIFVEYIYLFLRKSNWSVAKTLLSLLFDTHNQIAENLWLCEKNIIFVWIKSLLTLCFYKFIRHCIFRIGVVLCCDFDDGNIFCSSFMLWNPLSLICFIRYEKPNFSLNQINADKQA